MSNANRTPERYYVCYTEENQWAIVVLKDIVDTLETGYYFRIALKYAMSSIKEADKIITMENSKDFKYIGKTIAKCLKDAHDKDYANYVERAKEYIPRANAVNAKYNQYMKTRQKKRKPKSRGGPYIPRTRCGPWAILVTLPRLVDEEYILTWDRNGQQNTNPILFDAKKIKHESKKWSISSMYQKKRGYTAFDGIKTLIKYGYVKSHGDDTHDIDNLQYELTTDGYEIGLKLLEEYYANAEMNSGNDISDDSDSDDEYENKNKSPGQKRSRKSNNDRGENKKQKRDIPTFGGVKMTIVDRRDRKYKLTEPIKMSNGKKYYLYLNVDPRERSNCRSKRIDIFNKLKTDGNILASNKKLSTGDFCWLLINEDYPNDDEETLLLPFSIERKTWHDLCLSIYKDGRYEQQKYRMSYVMDDDEVMVGGRKIYLMEGRPDQDQVPPSRKEGCEQSVVGTSVIDSFHVYATQTKSETLRTLVNWTFMMRHWINGGYSKGMDGYQSKGKYLFDVTSLTSLAVFNKEADKIKLIDDLSPRMRWMEQLLTIPGCCEKEAYYISNEYARMSELCDAYDDCKQKWDNRMDESNDGFYTCTFYSCGRLNKNAYNFCPECGFARPRGIVDEEKKNGIEYNENVYHPELMIHKTVKVCGEWEYRTELMRKKLCDTTPDNIDPIINSALFTLRDEKHNGIYGKEEAISKRLSKRIYRMFGVEEVVELDSDSDSIVEQDF